LKKNKGNEEAIAEAAKAAKELNKINTSAQDYT